MVEVTLTCVVDKHEFTTKFADPVNWGAVSAALASTEPRCELHQEQVYNYCDYD